ncbi:AAA domain-containing protein [Halogeometricum sp. S1BR25-6]|uniref:AAA domain-containing protein n=1 Tax=Halogeometricum salsisoli TaxID=2950536 RepID=A0ABU2GJG3_9EURY|nr:AAA domain-containing protein [Halogeometricum sp. S1BR25-6]MDS0300930.1 AAA domain-containing protein [Halogeometricum sp. S1BR25-6]
MIQELFTNWRLSQARLLKANTRHGSYPSVDVVTAAQNAQNVLDIDAPDHKGYIIPLHDTNGPSPTTQYIIWRPKTETIGWFDTGFGSSGIERFTDAENLSDTIIGHRLRYWLSENQLDPAEIEYDLPKTEVSPSDTLSQAEQNRFFTKLKQFVRKEKQTARETNWDYYTDLGLEESIRRNQIAGPFIYIGTGQGRGGEQGLQFQITQDEDDDEEIDLRDDEGLFWGNLCIIDADVKKDAFPFPAKILDVNGGTLLFRPEWKQVNNRHVVEKHLKSGDIDVWVKELLNPVPYQRQLDAIQQVKQSNSKRQLITGTRPVEFLANEYNIPDPEIDLNTYQQKALTWADGATDIMCIHGPPGTGKTRTLTAYVQYAVSQDQSVLVTAHSNQAVDNLIAGDSTLDEPEADTLHAMAQSTDSPITIARVGSNTRNRVIEKNYLNKSIGAANVVAATTSGASEFDQNTFDIAIVDEATQASRPSTAIVLNCAKKLILAGDHKQLPPYCADETMQDEELHISLFEHLLDRYGPEISVLLRKQYRMNKEIADFPNQAFYDGELETAERNKGWQIDDLKPLMGIDIIGTEQRESYGNSFYNLEEAEAVAKQVKLLAMSGVSPEDIGVISAYSGQKRKIQRKINQLDIDGAGRVTVDTVDSFQGGEREAIIVSFVRSNDQGNSGFLEFPDVGPRRLNVALTRARKRLVLVGNWRTLGTRAPHRSSEDSCAHYYANLAEHIYSADRMLSLIEPSSGTTGDSQETFHDRMDSGPTCDPDAENTMSEDKANQDLGENSSKNQSENKKESKNGNDRKQKKNKSNQETKEDSTRMYYAKRYGDSWPLEQKKQFLREHNVSAARMGWKV